MDAVDYIDNLYSDYYQNQSDKSLDEIRALSRAKIKASNSGYAQPCICGTCANWAGYVNDCLSGDADITKDCTYFDCPCKGKYWVCA